MQLDSYQIILIFVGAIFLIGYLIIQATTQKHEGNKKSKKLFVVLLLGMFIGIAGDILMLRFPVKDYPQIAALINPTVFAIFFFFLPAIGAMLGVIIYSYVTRNKGNKNV